ncbi:restriction endonuclease subunit S [Parabacteroides johnsonii]|uniref:restriction endonuclease subunit S n=1 Tax=Parabacteroides johnsonii TaxID=387661 RepID=UPI0024333070|nr:restriction endonuclease subunit S [Parabacteroides johnsonii]MBS6225281.1 restriction endonuclease subunit S [Parabacteroides johnsonii]
MSQFIEMVGDPRNNPKGWPTKRLSELAEYSIGLTYKPEQICDDGTIVLRSGNIQDGKISFSDIVRVNAPIKESLFVKEDDILMCSRNGSASLVGKVAMIPDINEPMTFGAFMTIIRSAEAKYLYLYFQSQDFRERVSEGKSSTMNQITQKMLDKVEVPFPDKDVRETLSAIASQADKSKFGDFKSQFIEMFGTVESYCKLEDLVSDTFPGEWGSEPTSENAIKVIRTTNFTNEGHLDLADVVTRDIEPKKVARKKLKQGDTILERSGGTKDNPVGRVVFFDEIGDYLLNNFTQALRPKESVNPVYLFYALYNSYNINKAAMRAMASQTTGIQNLSMSDFMSKSIVLPSRDEQNKFEQIYRQADKSKSVIQKTLVYLNDIQSDELGKIA